MGCNTSQELRTKDDNTSDSIEKNDEQHLKNCNVQIGMKGVDLTLNVKNNSKPNSSKSNGEAKMNHAKETHDIPQKCSMRNSISDRDDISELNDTVSDEDERKAATKIQAAFRGHKARYSLKESYTKTIVKTSNTAIVSPITCQPQFGLPTEISVRECPSKLEVKFDENYKELYDVNQITKGVFREPSILKIKHNNTNKVANIPKITKKVTDDLDIDFNDPELNKAATKIQASFREHKLRKDVTTANN